MFSQSDRLVFEDSTSSGMNAGQLCGHSCFRIYKKQEYVSQRLDLGTLDVPTDLDQCEVQLVEICLFPPHRRLVRRNFNRYTNNKVPNALTM